MAFSIQHLMLFVTVMGVALTVSRYMPPATALTIIAGGGLFLLPFLRPDQRRSYAWGALSGVVLAILTIRPIVESYFGEITYARGTDHSAGVAFDAIVPYGVSVGWVLGGTIGLLSKAWNKSKERN